MLLKICGIHLASVVVLLTIVLLASMLPVLIQNIHEDAEKRHVERIEDSENAAIALAPPPPYITSSLAQTESSNEVTLVSWVETGQSIDLDNAARNLESEFEIIETNYDEGYLEAQKTLCPLDLFREEEERWDPPPPYTTIKVRVYDNGTIIAFSQTIDISPSNPESDLGLLAYFSKNDNEAPYLVITRFVVEKALEKLGLNQYRYSIKSGIIQYPNAKYIVFIWPESSNKWIEGSIRGYYRVSKEYDVIGAGLLLIIHGEKGHGKFRLEINGQTLIDQFHVKQHHYKWKTVNLHHQDNDYFQPGVTYNLYIEDESGKNNQFFFVIVAILG